MVQSPRPRLGQGGGGVSVRATSPRIGQGDGRAGAPPKCGRKMPFSNLQSAHTFDPDVVYGISYQEGFQTFRPKKLDRNEDLSRKIAQALEGSSDLHEQRQLYARVLEGRNTVQVETRVLRNLAKKIQTTFVRHLQDARKNAEVEIFQALLDEAETDPILPVVLKTVDLQHYKDMVPDIIERRSILDREADDMGMTRLQTRKSLMIRSAPQLGPAVETLSGWDHIHFNAETGRCSLTTDVAWAKDKSLYRTTVPRPEFAEEARAVEVFREVAKIYSILKVPFEIVHGYKDSYKHKRFQKSGEENWIKKLAQSRAEKMRNEIISPCFRVPDDDVTAKARITNCPAGHLLAYYPMEAATNCANCNARLQMRDEVIGCRQCDFHICASCHPEAAAVDAPGFFQYCDFLFQLKHIAFSNETQMAELVTDLQYEPRTYTPQERDKPSTRLSQPDVANAVGKEVAKLAKIYKTHIDLVSHFTVPDDCEDEESFWLEELALNKAEQMKDVLVRLGVDEDRLGVATSTDHDDDLALHFEFLPEDREASSKRKVAQIDVVGAGNEDFNGTYNPVGEKNGHTKYRHVRESCHTITFGKGFWYLCYNHRIDQGHAYKARSSDMFPPSSGWKKGFRGGADPVPNLTVPDSQKERLHRTLTTMTTMRRCSSASSLKSSFSEQRSVRRSVSFKSFADVQAIGD